MFIRPRKPIAGSRSGGVRRPRRGAAALEFALLLPLFLLIIFGILEFGRALMVYQVTTNAAREAARRSVIAGTTNGEVTGLINDYLDGASVSPTGRTIEILDENGNAGTMGDISSHQEVTIVITVPFEQNNLGLSRFLANKQMQTRVTMRRE